MPLTENAVRSIVEALQRNNVSLNCSACNQANGRVPWGVAEIDFLAIPNTQSADREPVITLVCRQCGAISQHSSKGLWP